MKIFIDCGSHKGEIIKKIRSNYDKIYAWECNKECEKINYGKNVERVRFAVWIENGELEFNINKDELLKDGHSIFSDKKTGGLNKKLIVPCKDFSQWLKDTVTKEDKVVVKMNIEGAEYDVLNKCIDDGTIELIDVLYIRYHQHKIPSISKQTHNSLIERLKKTNLKIYTDYKNLK